VLDVAVLMRMPGHHGQAVGSLRNVDGRLLDDVLIAERPLEPRATERLTGGLASEAGRQGVQSPTERASRCISGGVLSWCSCLFDRQLHGNSSPDRWLLPNRDVRCAVAGEWLAIPAGPPFP